MVVTGRSRSAARHICVLLSAALITMSTPFGAVTAEDRNPQPVSPPEEEMWLHAEVYAAEFEVATEEAFRRLSLHDDLRAAVAAIKDREPDRFGGAWFEHLPEFRVVVRVKGSASLANDVTQIASASPAPMILQLGADHSVADLLAGVQRVNESLRSHSRAAGVSLDLKTAQVVIGTTAFGSALRRQIISEAAVPVRFEEAVSFAPAHTYGGRQLDRFGMRECSTGFTVGLRGTSTTGVTTAGHCSEQDADRRMLYREKDGIPPYWVYLQGERWDSDQDAQWMIDKTGHPEYPQFWTGTGWSAVTATAARLEMTGDAVCHWGATTGRSCGTIQSIHLDPGNICGPGENEDCAATWVDLRGSTLVCDGGDSGGPVFRGGTAYGLLTHHSTTDPHRCLFMSIGFLGQMNLDVLLAS